ncbi:MAG: hypothetical protein KatS3mg107_0774 [Gemmataceae bacterium]|nr:MAG: hypothetical protein KatS3mg107_0774 [Gemmataceae bacterium]
MEAVAGPLQPLLQRSQYSRQRMMTLGDLLLENRIIFVGASPDTGGSPVITDFLASVIIQRLLYLQYENKTADIHMYINSPGGSVSATLAVYDTMQFLEAPIHTYCMGLAASGAAILSGSRYEGEALLSSQLQGDDPSTLRSGGRAGVGHRDSGQRDFEGTATPQRNPGPAYGPAAGGDCPRDGSRPILPRV